MNANNVLPSGIGDLFHLAGSAQDGIARHGRWLFQDRMQPGEIGDVLKAAQRAEKEFGQARLAKAAAAARFAEADAELTSWLAKARLVVMLAYGSKWSESWIAAGFTHRGTNVPKRIRPRIELSRRLAEFLGEHPQYEVAFAGVTAAEAGAGQRKITTLEQELRRAEREAAEKKRVRDRAEKRLRKELRLLRIWLTGLLKKSDPRWKDFGFKVPKPDGKPLVRYSTSLAAEPVRVDFSTDRAASAPESAVA